MGFSPSKVTWAPPGPAGNASALFSASLSARILLPLGGQGGQKKNQVLSSFSLQAAGGELKREIRQSESRARWAQ